jgi:hypothetical protein
MLKTKITGYWTFFCNPKYWAVDEFLLKIKPNFKSEYRIASWQKDFFEKGQLGVIRVGTDGRNKAQLNGRKKLDKGVYAIVEIIGSPFQQGKSESDFKINRQKDESGRFIVPIKYIRNYIANPILFSDLENDIVIKSDSYLLKGIQAASMPLLEDSFNRILLYGEENFKIRSTGI